MILIDDSDDEIQDAAPSEGTVHSHTLTVLHSNKPCPNHIAQVPHQLGRDASDGFLQDINVQSISKATIAAAKD